MSLPAVLLPYQQRWVSDAADVAVWEKSRRIGASWGDGSASVLESSAEGGQDALYIGYSEDMTREYIEDCAMWAKAFQRAASGVQETLYRDEDRDIKAFRIDFANDRKVLALSSRPRSIRGKQGRVTIDEAAFHDDLPGLLKAALAMLIWGGKVRVLSSHNGVDNPFNQLVQEIRAGKLPYSLHRTTLDDALADGLYRRICLVKGQPWTAEGEAAWRADLVKKYGAGADEELFCVPRDGTGMWLSRALIESCMAEVPVIRWSPPQGFVFWPEAQRVAEVSAWCEAVLGPVLEALDPAAQSFLGEDFGRFVDLTVIAPLLLGQDLVRRAPFLLELSDCPFEAQKQIFFYVADRLPRFRKGLMDATGNGSYLAEVAMQRYGSRIEPVVFSQGWYRDNTAPFKSAFEDRTIVVPRDRDVMDDLRVFELVAGVPQVPAGRRLGEDGKTRHGDAGVAYLLAYQASRAPATAIEFMSTGVARESTTCADFLPP